LERADENFQRLRQSAEAPDRLWDIETLRQDIETNRRIVSTRLSTASTAD